jgi:hypothetical protein
MFEKGDFYLMLELDGLQDFRELILQKESLKKLLFYLDEKSLSFRHHTFPGVITMLTSV